MATWTYLMPVSGNNATMELLSSHTRPRARLGALSLHFQVFYVFVFETNETSLFHCQKTYKATGMDHFVFKLGSYLCTPQMQTYGFERIEY